ncbi:hypothetical protein ACHAXN_005407 [Cyclotella atomus]
MGFICKITSIICRSAMLSIQILTFLLLGVVNAAFVCPIQRSIIHDNLVHFEQNITLKQRRASFILLNSHARKRLTVLRGSLRDILNDGPTTASEIVNSHIDTVEQRQKLTNQLKNFSTQEIKRELEQTYKISTAALRGKDQLISALVMARLTGSLSTPPMDGGVDPNFRDEYKEPSRGESYANGSSWLNNANYQKDMELMSVGEIKRELQLYGVSVDMYADKMQLLSVLVNERRIRNIPTPSKRPKIEVNVVPTAAPSRLKRNPPPGMSDEEGNESIRSPSRMAELTKVTILTKNQKEAKKSQSQQSNDNFYGSMIYPFSDFSDRQQEEPYYATQGSQFAIESPYYADNVVAPPADTTRQDGSYDGAKLRELQIAFEFDRIQAALLSPDQIQQELAAKFNIDTKYFMGVNEMVYALAVARVDAAIERENRRRSGKDDGCEVSTEAGGAPISKNRNANFDGVTSSNFSNGQTTRPECIDGVNSGLASREELISMEFQRLQPLDEYELSWELEAQYGIPAKHFLGKKELAYALAVERVDSAQREADAANQPDSQSEFPPSDSDQFAWMSDEDMMRMMEEEMMKEAEPQNDSNANADNKFSKRQNGQQQQSKSSQQTSLKDMIQNNSKKAPRSQQAANGSFQYQGETLREREIRENKAKQTQMGTVVGSERWDASSVSNKKQSAPQRNEQTSSPNKAQSPPLSDILKGSTRSRTSARQKSRVRATSPPPRQTTQQRPPRSASKASSPFDVSFGVGAWKTSGGIGNNAYQNSYGMPPRSPFEVPDFPDPAMFANYQPEPPPPPFGAYSYSDQAYSDSMSFEPGKFTPPRKHAVDPSMPPPSRRKNDSRGFNIRDTAGPRPFIGVQTVMDQYMPPSPPLTVDPPPPDESNPPPKRPFEPAPFSRPQPHTVYNDRPPREPRGSRWKTAPPPPPKNRWNPGSRSKPTGPSPYNRVKDLFANNKSSKSKEVVKDKQTKFKHEDQVKFKYDKIEVMNDEWSPFEGRGPGRRQNIKKVVDAEVDAGNEDQYQGFANAWKGGPKSEQLGRDKISSPNRPPVAMMKAYELLSNPEVQAVAAKARSHPKVKEAVLACMGDPTKFGAYLDDNDIGPILRELKSSIEEQ